MEYNETGTKSVRYAWSVLCSSSSHDPSTNVFTIYNLIDDVSINIGKEMVEKREADKSGGYAIPLELHIVTKLKKRDDGKDASIDIKFEEINPEGKILNSSDPMRIDIRRPIRNFRIRNNYSPLLVDKSGEYQIRVLIKDYDESSFVEVDRISLDVNVVEARKTKSLK